MRMCLSYQGGGLLGKLEAFVCMLGVWLVYYLGLTRHKFKNLFILFDVYLCLVCMYECGPHVCLIHTEVRSGWWAP